jgi:hypothetical protein
VDSNIILYPFDGLDVKDNSMAKFPGAPSGNIDLTRDIPGKYRVY